MVLVWIGIAIGVLVALVLIYKVIKSPPHEAIYINLYCQKCGFKKNGLKCPRCESESSSYHKYK